MKINQPRIPNPLEEREFKDILKDEYHEMLLGEIKQAEFTNEVLHDMRLGQTVIKNSQFANTDFRGMDLSDVRFEHCDF